MFQQRYEAEKLILQDIKCCVKIPINTTFWTAILRRKKDKHDECVCGKRFPSRLMIQDDSLQIYLVGIDNDFSLKHEDEDEKLYEYSIVYALEHDYIPSYSTIMIPLGYELSFDYSYGNMKNYCVASGIKIKFDYDIQNKILKTDWFQNCFSATWSLFWPRQILKSMGDRISQKLLL